MKTNEGTLLVSAMAASDTFDPLAANTTGQFSAAISPPLPPPDPPKLADVSVTETFMAGPLARSCTASLFPMLARIRRQMSHSPMFTRTGPQ